MSITYENSGFKTAHLVTDENTSEFYAEYDSDNDDFSFEVALGGEEDLKKARRDYNTTFFWEADCREAAEFFTNLADELAVRKASK